MDLTAFKDSLSSKEPSPDLSAYLKALWYDAQENWDKAHTLMQDLNDKNAAWIHAYLHRKEGDASNAGYWYNRAGKQIPSVSLEKEWEEIVTAFL